MIRPPGLRLLSVIDDEHRHDRGGKPVLIPCIHEELDQDLELLAAGARRSGGTLFDLNAEIGWEHPPGPIVQDRQDLVDGLLSAAAGDSLPGPVEFVEEDGGVVARLAGKNHNPPEPSLTLILRAAALIASSAYDQFDLVIVAASTSSTDPHRRELLWKMLTVDPNDLGLRSTATTIVPVIGTRTDPETDYRRQPPPRYVIRWDRVLKRSPAAHGRGVEAIAGGEGPLVLFLGAGASATSGIQLGNAYRDVALRALVGDRPDKAEAFFDYLHDRGRFMAGETQLRSQFAEQLTLERVLRETFAELGFRPRTDSPVIQELTKDCLQALGFVRPGRKALRELATRLRGRLIIMTVNFDRLAEDGLDEDHMVLFTPQHFDEHLEDLRRYATGDASVPVPILKLHGSIEDPQSLIATIDTTSAGLHENVRRALNVILGSSQLPLRWVWVGCSMRDQDVTAWLGGLSAEALDEWWVDPLPSQSLDEFFAARRAPIWTPRGYTLDDRLIVDSADGFLKDLSAYVAEHHS